MKLAELQARFYELVTARESVAATLAARGPEARAAVEGAFAGDASLSAVGRLEIYADMYFVRIHDVLRDELARTAALLGARSFHALVTDYLAACRPSHPSLREAGARLPAFFVCHPLGLERPWLPELARLERTRLELFDGPDADALAVETLRALPPERFGPLVLQLVPCHALLENRFSVAPLWRDDVTAEERPETLLVWRREVDVYHRAVEPDEAHWLRRCAEGMTLETLCEELGRTLSDEAAAARAFELVGRWTADGLLRATVS